MAFKVVVNLPENVFPGEEESLTKIGASLIKVPCTTEDEIIANCHDADGVIIGGGRFTKRVIEALKKCRVLSRLGVGYDSIDVEAATARDIAVAIVTNANTIEVSDHAMALLLSLARKIIPLNQTVRAGMWGSPEIFRIGRPLYRLFGQTLGLIGLGNIGRLVARKAQAFGLNVIAYDPFLYQIDIEDLGVKLVELDYLLQNSDYISIHCPLNNKTRHLINLEAFKKMRKSVYIINTARGGVVDEKALYTALAEGYIAGAGLDLTDPEPPQADNPLLQCDNVIITPHFAFYSEESVAEVRRGAVDAVVQVLQGGWPRTLVNPEIKERLKTS